MPDFRSTATRAATEQEHSGVSPTAVAANTHQHGTTAEDASYQHIDTSRLQVAPEGECGHQIGDRKSRSPATSVAAHRLLNGKDANSDQMTGIETTARSVTPWRRSDPMDMPMDLHPAEGWCETSTICGSSNVGRDSGPVLTDLLQSCACRFPLGRRPPRPVVKLVSSPHSARARTHKFKQFSAELPGIPVGSERQIERKRDSAGTARRQKDRACRFDAFSRIDPERVRLGRQCPSGGKVRPQISAAREAGQRLDQPSHALDSVANDFRGSPSRFAEVPAPTA